MEFVPCSIMSRDIVERGTNSMGQTLFLYFNLKQKPLFTNNVGHTKNGKNIYRMRAIITQGLYTFYPLFEVSKIYIWLVVEPLVYFAFFVF